MSTSTKVFTAIQMIGIILISNSLFLNINSFSYEQIGIFSLFLVSIPTITTCLMQNNKFALHIISIFSVISLLVCFSNLIPAGALATQFTISISLVNILFILYQIIFAGKYEEFKLSNIRS